MEGRWEGVWVKVLWSYFSWGLWGWERGRKGTVWKGALGSKSSVLGGGRRCTRGHGGCAGRAFWRDKA